MLEPDTVRALFTETVGVGVATEGREGMDIPELTELDPSATESRRIEFRLGRLAARDALTDLGAPVVPIPIGAGGEPVWPDGVVGSIGHAGGVAVSATGWSRKLFAMGVDVERESRRLGDGAMRRVCTADERAWLASSANPDRDALVLFGAKEASYKALAGVGAARLRFQELSFSPTVSGTLVGRVDVPGSPREIIARHLTAGGFVVVAVEIPRSDALPDAPEASARDAGEPIDRIRESLGEG